MNQQGINFLESIDSKKIKLGLSRTTQLLQACSNPHLSMNIIQIVGTNGKGSTAAMIAHTLIKNQYKTGLFTSPHLVIMNERIRINNTSIPNTYINTFIFVFVFWTINFISRNFCSIQCVRLYRSWYRKHVVVGFGSWNSCGWSSNISVLVKN